MPESAIAEQASYTFTGSQAIEDRYQSLIRIAASIRAQKDARSLFGILVHELGQVLQFDGIAQFDEAANKVDWHFCTECSKPEKTPDDIDKGETIAAWVYEHQETIVLGNLDRDTAASDGKELPQAGNGQASGANALGGSGTPPVLPPFGPDDAVPGEPL